MPGGSWSRWWQGGGSSDLSTCSARELIVLLSAPARAPAPYNASCGTREAFADLIWVHVPRLRQLRVSREPSLKSCRFAECWQLQDYFRPHDLSGGEYTRRPGPDLLARNSNCHSCVSFSASSLAGSVCRQTTCPRRCQVTSPLSRRFPLPSFLPY